MKKLKWGEVSITHPSFHSQKGQHSGCQPAQQPPEHLLPLTPLPPVTIFRLCLLPPLGPLLLTFAPSHPDLQPQVLVMIAHCAEYRTYLWGLKLSTHRGKERYSGVRGTLGSGQLGPMMGWGTGLSQGDSQDREARRSIGHAHFMLGPTASSQVVYLDIWNVCCVCCACCIFKRKEQKRTGLRCAAMTLSVELKKRVPRLQ